MAILKYVPFTRKKNTTIEKKLALGEDSLLWCDYSDKNDNEVKYRRLDIKVEIIEELENENN